MSRSSVFRSERFASNSASSEARSGPGMALDRSFSPRSIEGHQGFSQPVVYGNVGVRLDRACRGIPRGGPSRRRPGTNRMAPTVEFPAQCCPDCTDGRVFQTRSSYNDHLKRMHGQYWNKRGWIGFIGRPARRSRWDTLRSPPPAPRIAPPDVVVEASPPRAARGGVSPPRAVVQRDMPPPAADTGVSPPRAAVREASPPRFDVAEEVWSPRATEAGASLPRSAPALVTNATSQFAANAFPPTGTGIPANIGVLPPPVAANVGSVAAYGPVLGPWPVRRAEGEVDDAPLRTLSPPSRDTEVVSLPAASLGTVWTGDGRFPLSGLSRTAGFAPLSSRVDELDVRRRLGPPVERLQREIPLTRARDPPAAVDALSSPQEDVSIPPVQFQSQAAAMVVDMPPAQPSSPVACGDGHAEVVGVADSEPQAQSATRQWVRPRMKYEYITSAMRRRWLEGVSAVPSLTAELFAAYDPDCSMWELRNRIEHMVMARQDFCIYLHNWLRGRLAMPEADHRGILQELLHMMSFYGRLF